MECERYFLSIDEAVALTLWAAVLPSGRYAVDPGLARNMVGVALELYPGRPHRLLPRRRGDRAREPLLASHEEIRETDHDWIWQIVSHHDVEGVGSE
jgi:FlaA1/EpsC-like NDP-sugar epimerase